jgi:hypothetical protein
MQPPATSRPPPASESGHDHHEPRRADAVHTSAGGMRQRVRFDRLWLLSLEPADIAIDGSRRRRPSTEARHRILVRSSNDCVAEALTRAFLARAIPRRPDQGVPHRHPRNRWTRHHEPASGIASCPIRGTEHDETDDENPANLNPRFSKARPKSSSWSSPGRSPACVSRWTCGLRSQSRYDPRPSGFSRS